ncbi:family 16 glycosylhydrolase [Bradyrhizobium sp. DN5]|uniref:glycoside hydrolase family 16 protein n=1 Tax=Bradyrhizobium sp. DN5 TaxID=3056950 RepID=UPI00352627B3
MKLLFCRAFALTLMALSVAASAQPAPPQQAVRAGFTRLIFNDDFLTLDLSADGEGDHAWYNNLWYQAPSERDRFRLEGGILTLATRDDRVNMTSIVTVPHKNGRRTIFGHGYFEARLKWPSDPNNFAAFWLFSDAHARGTDGDHWCEIDIYESFKDDLYLGTVHEWRPKRSTPNPNNYHRLSAPIAVNQWNIYGLLWEKGKVTWYLNNVEQMSATTPEICEAQKLFLILSAQKRGGKADQTLSVDWVRVFAAPD